MTESPARLYIYPAREVPKAVVLRHGPHRHWLMCTWDLMTDAVVTGQWFRSPVTPSTCATSPGGRYFAATVRDYRPAEARPEGRQSSEMWWIAISRPPFFTALAIQSCPPSRHGPRWDSENRILTDCSSRWKLNAVPPDRFSFDPILDGEGLHEPDHPNKWVEHGEHESMCRWKNTKVVSCWQGKERTSRIYFESELLKELRTLEQSHSARSVPDIFLDFYGKPYWSSDGRLFRWHAFPKGEPQSVADLNHKSFELVEPTEEALSW